MSADNCPNCGCYKDWDEPVAASDASFVSRKWSCGHCGSSGEAYYEPIGDYWESEEDQS